MPSEAYLNMKSDLEKMGFMLEENEYNDSIDILFDPSIEGVDIIKVLSIGNGVYYMDEEPLKDIKQEIYDTLKIFAYQMKLMANAIAVKFGDAIQVSEDYK